MEPKYEATQTQFRSGEMGTAFDEFHGLISCPPATSGSSFTALLELPPPQAVELLVKDDFPTKHPPPPPIFPTDIGLVHRASKFSIFASVDNSLESMKFDAVKQEHLDSECRRSSSSPAGSDQCLKSGKRKEKEKDKKVNDSNKRSKHMSANEPSDDDGGGEKLPYVHVRARRGQATDSHSLAERARREKINARMKLLQELVPGCNKLTKKVDDLIKRLGKQIRSLSRNLWNQGLVEVLDLRKAISGTAMVLDEIINHVQALQRHVEFLSMRLAAVNPGIDSDLDSLFTANGCSNESGYSGMFTPPIWAGGQMNGTRQLQFEQVWHGDELHQSVWAREDDSSNFITPANSLLSYDSSANSGQLKTEL